MLLDPKIAPFAVTLLRVALGVMFIAHSLLLKLFVFTLPGTAQFFTSIGLPGWFAYVVFAAEAVGARAVTATPRASASRAKVASTVVVLAVPA